MVQTAQTSKEEETSPLNQLATLLDRDMRAVNDLIIANMQSDVALIPQLAHYLIAAGGKRIRPLLTLAATSLFDGPMDKSYHLAAAVEFIHTATLLHDDVVDESAERRGQQAANLIFGNQASVLVGDFLFSKSFQMMVESGSLDILRILSNASATIAQGEVLQLSTTNDITTDMSSYLKVIESKTAVLFAASCEVGAVLSNQEDTIITAMRHYGMAIGNAFQMIDDALDYSADQKKLGKDIGDDFKEGKMTAPVILSLENASSDERAFWKRTMGDKQQVENDFAQAMDIITRHDGLTQTISRAQAYADDAKNALASLPPSELKSILCDLANYVITRNF